MIEMEKDDDGKVPMESLRKLHLSLFIMIVTLFAIMVVCSVLTTIVIFFCRKKN